jgi:hypothetical protein
VARVVAERRTAAWAAVRLADWTNLASRSRKVAARAATVRFLTAIDGIFKRAGVLQLVCDRRLLREKKQKTNKKRTNA